MKTFSAPIKIDTEPLERLFNSIELSIKIILAKVVELEKRLDKLEDK